MSPQLALFCRANRAEQLGYQGVKPADICSRFLDPTETLPAPCRMKRRWRVVLLRAKGEILGNGRGPRCGVGQGSGSGPVWSGRSPALRGSLCRSTIRQGGRTTHLLRQPTGNPSQYEVIKDGQIVGRISLFRALPDERKPWIRSIDLAFRAGHEPVAWLRGDAL